MTALATPDSSRATAAAGIDRAIRLFTAAAVLAVAGIAAYVSYWQAYAVIRAHGESGITARLEPATIDGLVYASSMVILYSARHRLSVPALARWLLGLGIAATLTANMAQGWSHGPVATVVAAWPAVSLVGSYELLVWIIRISGALECELPEEPCCEDTEGQTAGWPSTPASKRHPAGNHGAVDDSHAAVTAYHLSVKAGNPLSERKLAHMFGRTSRRWARARIAEARDYRIADSPR